MNGDPYLEIRFPYVPISLKVNDWSPTTDLSCSNTSGIYDLFNPDTGANGLVSVTPPDKRDEWLAVYNARTDLNPPPDMQNSQFERALDFDYVQPPYEVHIHSTVNVQLLEAQSRP